MGAVTVAVSTVADGSMYLRREPGNSEIIENRKRWFARHSIDAADTTRVFVTFDDTEDFCRYVEVDASNKGQGMTDNNLVHADALITKTPGHALFLSVADCIATTIFDEEHGILMLSHLGRHSLEQEAALRVCNILSSTTTVTQRH